MKNRIELAEFFRDQGYVKGVEVGVCDGRYSKVLMDTIPGLRLFGIDPYFEYDGDSKNRHQEHHDKHLHNARAILMPLKGYSLILSRSVDAVELFQDNSLDFVFIDANHTYEAVKEDITTWYPKVRSGGVLSGHDYYPFKSGKGGVIPAVTDFIERTGEELQTTEWDKEAHKDDQQPDWYIIKK